MKIDIKIKDEARLRYWAKESQEMAEEYLTKGIHDAIFKIFNESQDQEKNLKFKRPTGRLRASFQQGIQLKKLEGSIGPRTNYAHYVYFGTRYLRPQNWSFGGESVRAYNPYIDRILHSSLGDIDEAINDQIDAFLEEITD